MNRRQRIFAGVVIALLLLSGGTTLWMATCGLAGCPSVDQLRGFPSHDSKDVYGLDVYFELNTFEIQWANKDDDSTADVVSEIAQEQKQTFKDVVDSFEALARTFAKQDSAI